MAAKHGTIGYILLNHTALSQNTKLYVHRQWMRKLGMSTLRSLFHRDCYIQMVITFPFLTSVFPDYTVQLRYIQTTHTHIIRVYQYVHIRAYMRTYMSLCYAFP